MHRIVRIVAAALLGAPPALGPAAPEPNHGSLEAEVSPREAIAVKAARHEKAIAASIAGVKEAFDAADKKVGIPAGLAFHPELVSVAERSRQLDVGCTTTLTTIKRLGTEGPGLSADIADVLDRARKDVAVCRGFTAAMVTLEVNRALQKTADFYRAAQRARQEMEGALTSLGGAEEAVRKEIAAIANPERWARAALRSAEDDERALRRVLAELDSDCKRQLDVLRGWQAAGNLKPESHTRLGPLLERAQVACKREPVERLMVEGRNGSSRLTDEIEDRKKLAGRFSLAPCGDVRTVYPQVVQAYEANWLAAALQLSQGADLPAKAAACRDRSEAPQPPSAAGSVGASAAPAATALTEVPNLVGVGSGQLEGVLGASGLSLGAVSAAGNPAKPELAFTVASQDPLAETKVERGRAVSVSIWQGPIAPPPTGSEATPEPTVASGRNGGVPNVVNDSLDQAVAKLEAAGLRVGSVTRGGKPPRSDLAGRIYFQNPPAGSPLPANRQVAVKQYDKAEAEPPTVRRPAGCATDFAGRWTEQLPSLGVNFTMGKGLKSWQGVMTIRSQGGGYVVDFGIPEVPVMATRVQGDKLTFEGQIDSSAAEGWPLGTYVSFMQFEMAMSPTCWIDMKVRETVQGTSKGVKGQLPPFDSGPWTRVP